MEGSSEFTPEAAKWPSEKLFRAAEAVQAMLETEGWAVVQELIGASEQRLQNLMIHSIASNQAGAAQIAGRIQSLGASKNAAQGILGAAVKVREQLERKAAQERTPA